MKKFLSQVYNLINPYRGLPRPIYILVISVVINTSGSYIVPLLTLILTKKLGISIADTGLFISIIGLIYIGSNFISGKLTDRFGGKRVLIICTTVSACSYLIAAFIGLKMTIIPLIIVAGMLSNMARTAQSALVATLTVPSNRKNVYSLFYIGMNIGYAVSPLVGGLLFENYFKLLFIGDAVTTLISVSLILLYVKETSSENMYIEEKKTTFERSEVGSIFKVLSSRRILIFYSLVMFGYNLVYFLWVFLCPITLENIFVNGGAVIYGECMVFNAVVVITLTPLITSLISRLKELKAIFIAGILYTIGVVMFSFVSSVFGFLCSTFIITIGEIIVGTNSMPFIINHTPTSHRGRMTSIVFTIMSIGQNIGPLIIGRYILVTSINNGWRLTGLIMMAFTFLMFCLHGYDNKKSRKMIPQ